MATKVRDWGAQREHQMCTETQIIHAKMTNAKSISFLSLAGNLLLYLEIKFKREANQARVNAYAGKRLIHGDTLFWKLKQEELTKNNFAIQQCSRHKFWYSGSEIFIEFKIGQEPLTVPVRADTFSSVEGWRGAHEISENGRTFSFGHIFRANTFVSECYKNPKTRNENLKTMSNPLPNFLTFFLATIIVTQIMPPCT